MTKGPRLPPSAIDTASSMSTKIFGQPLTDNSVVDNSGLRARDMEQGSAIGGFQDDDEWAVCALRAMLKRTRDGVIRQLMADAKDLSLWRL